jgi:autotransporter-associated beta strand protein
MKTSLVNFVRSRGFSLFNFTRTPARCFLVLTALLLLVQHAGATFQYFSYTTGRPAWNGSYWGAAVGGPYTVAWTGYNDAVFITNGGPVNLGANQQANTLTFTVPGYALTNSSYQVQFGNPTWPGMFVTNGVVVSNNCIWTTSGSGNTIQIGGTNSYSIVNGGYYAGTNVFTGSFQGLLASSRSLSLNAGGLYLATATNALDGGGTITISNSANLTYDCSGTVNWGVIGAATIAGKGTFTKRGAGTLAFGAGGSRIYMNLGAGGLIDVEAGSLTGSSGGNGFWNTNLAAMTIASGASVNFVEAGVAAGAATIQLDGLNGAGAMTAGYQGYTKTLILGITNGSGNFTGPIAEGNSSGAGQLIIQKNGTGTQVLGGTNYFRYGLVVNNGTLILTTNNFLSNGGISITNPTPLTAQSTLTIGGGINTGAANQNAINRVSGGGILNYTNNGIWNQGSTGANYWYVGYGLGTGVVNQTTGTINYAVGGSATTYLLLGNGSSANNWGIYNLLGGTLTSVGQIMMGANANCADIFNVSNATLVAYNGVAIGRQDTTGSINTTNIFNQNGGAVYLNQLYIGTQASEVSFLNVSNGTFIATNFPNLATSTGDAAAIYLGRNSLVTLPAFPAAHGSGSTAILVLDGTTLTAEAPSTTYMQNLNSVTITPAGATINVPLGNDITIGQALADATSNGNIIKLGVGNLTLGGANTYSGSTTISNGTLTVNGSIANSAVTNVYGTAIYANGTIGGSVSLAGGATLGGGGVANGVVTVANAATVSPGVSAGAIGTLTVNNNMALASGAALAIDINTNTDPTFVNNTAGYLSDMLQVNGSLTAGGPVTVFFNFPNGTPVLGTSYVIITNANDNIAPGFAANLVAGTHLYSATFAQSPDNSQVTVTFGPSAGLNQLTWQGDGSANLWEIGLVQDWTNSLGSASFFYLGDNVTFDDTSTNQIVNLFGPMSAASVTVNSTKNYLITGNGKITGNSGLTQAGSGSVTLAVANDYVGNTLISGGTLIFTNNASVAGNITNNALLTFNRTDISSVTNPISGSGSLNFIGSGQVTLAAVATNNYTGQTVITNTRVYPQNANSFGVNTSPVLVTNNGGIYATTALGFVQPLILSGSGYLAGGTLRAGGNAAVTAGGPITLASASTIAVDSGATLSLTNPAGISGTNSILTLSYTGVGTISGPVSLGATYLNKQASGTAILAATNNSWTGGTLIGAGTLQIGDGAFNLDGSLGTGPITNNGALTFTSATNFTINDNITGTGSFNVNGSGTVTLNDIATNGAVNVNGAVGATSILNLTGPNFTAANTFSVGNAANNATGVVNQTTGTVVVSSGTELLLGNGGPAVTTVGYYNLYGGSLICTGATYGVLMGVNSGDTGIFTMTNGTLRVNSLEVSRSSSSVTNSTGVYLQTGGSTIASTISMGGSGTTNFPGANASFTVNATTAPTSSFIVTNFTYLGVGNNNIVNITLGLGAQVTLPAFPTTRGTSATVNLTLDGCTLTPFASSVTYISQLSSAIITGNGATLNVPTNISITIPQALTYDSQGDTCPLTVQGGGTVTLTGQNIYGYGGGLTTVTNAGLYLGSSGSISGQVYVGGGGTFGGNGTIVDGVASILQTVTGSLEIAANGLLYPGTSATVGTLNIDTHCQLDSGSSVTFNLTSVTNAGNNDIVNVIDTGSLGTLVANGPVTVTFNFWPKPAIGQPYILFTADAIDPAFVSNLVAGPSDYTATFAVDSTTTNVIVTFSDNPLAHLVWLGDGVINQWTNGLAGEWTNGIGPCVFKTADQVSFIDGTTNVAVNIPGIALPGAVTVSAVTNYTFQGSGKISGYTALTLNGPGTLTVTTTNDYTGGTFVNGGVLAVPNTNTVPGNIFVTNPGTVWFSQVGSTIYYTNNISGNGTNKLTACGTGSSSSDLTGNLTNFSGVLDIYPSTGGGGKWSLINAVSFPSAAALIKIENGGTLFINNGSTLASSIALYGGSTGEAYGQLRCEGNCVVSGPITLFANSTIGDQTTTSFGTISNVISDGGLNYGLTKQGTGTNIFFSYNTYGGGTTISGGALLLNNQNAVSNSLVTLSGGGLLFGLVSPSYTLGGLAGTTALAVQTTNSPTPQPIALTIGNNNSSGTFSAVLSGLATSSLLKLGSGTETFSGLNTYAGSIEVSQGFLVLTTNSVASTNLVDANGTLAATGTNTSVIIVNGTLAPGGIGSAGTLVLTNALTLGNNSTLQVDLGTNTAVGGGTNDLILLNGVNGNLAINGQVNVAVGVVGLAPVLSSPYTIIQFAGSLGGMGGGFQLANSQYTGYFTTNIGSPSTITLTLTGVTANNNVVWQGNGLNNYWMVDVLGWTNTAGVGLLDYYYSGDNVFFNDTATNRLVSLQGATYPASVTVTNSAGNYGFSGSGLLAGTTGILKDGTGTLAVSNANTFTGQVTIQGGTFLVGNVLALGATNVPTIVTNNGTGLNGTLDVNSLDLGIKPIIVSGAGVGGYGAIVNNGPGQQQNALFYVTMAGDTTFGGSQRWDMRATNNMNATLTGPYNVTKVGTNQVSMVGVTIDPLLGNIDVQNGLFSFETTSTGLGDPTKTLTLETNTTFQMYNATNLLNKPIVMNGATILDGAGANTIISPITLNQILPYATNVINTTGGNLSLWADLGGTAPVTKISGNSLILTTNNDWSGGLTIAAGTVQVGTNGFTSQSGTFGTGNVTNNGVLNLQVGVPLTYNGNISGTGSLYNASSNTLTLNGINTYSGGTTLTLGGNTVPGANNALGSGPLTMGDVNGNAATLLLTNVSISQTVSNLVFKNNSVNTNWINISTGNILLVSNTIAGNAVNVGNFSTAITTVCTQMVSIAGAGTLAVGAPLGTFSVEMSSAGTNNFGVLDMSGLSNFTANVSTFNAGTVGTVGGANSPYQMIMLLAQSNAITSTNIVLFTPGTGNGTGHAIHLGQNNTLNASNIVVAGGRDTLLVNFQSVPSPTLTIGGIAGVGSRANIKVGDNVDYNGGSTTANGILDLSAGSFTGMMDNVILGYGGQGVSSVLRAFATGTLILGNSANSVNVNNLTLGRAANYTGVTSTNYTSAGSLVMSNGTLTVNTSLVLGQNDQTNGTYGQRESGSFTLYGGTATVPGIILGTHTAVPADVYYATGLVAVVGGTLSASSDITNGIGNTYASLTVNGGTLNLNGNKIGSATRAVDAVSFQSGTVSNLGELNGGSNLVKTTTGTLTLAGVNTYTGATVVSNGTLLVNGSIAAGPVTVNAGTGAGTLGGVGTGNGPVSIQTGAFLAPGTGSGLGTLSISNTLTLNTGSTTTLAIDRTLGTANFGKVQGITTASFGGTLTVTSLGGTFQANDSFQLFSASTYMNNFTATNLPILGTGLGWNWDPTTGTLSVVATVNTNPTNLVFNLTGNSLSLTWPGDHLGWTLQTNSVDVSNTNEWFAYPGSASVTNVIINVDPSQPQVFYRLRYP